MICVGNIVIVNKYINKYKYRHVKTHNNIAFWCRINDKHVNKHSRNVIINNTQFIDKKNAELIIKCIENSIFINPITYWMEYNDIKVLTYRALESYNINYIGKYDIKHIDKIFWKSYLINVCLKGHIRIIKYIHKIIGLNILYFEYCYYYSHNVLIWLITNKMFYKKQDVWDMASSRGDIKVIMVINKFYKYPYLQSISNHKIIVRYAQEKNYQHILNYLKMHKFI